ncbi:MAG: aldo/keto reductase family protein [Gammaproteobacteria bacterium]
MEYRRLGRSELSVSEIALGSWLTYGVGVGKSKAEACVTAAFEAGINFLDTANAYGKGAAETVLGDILQRSDRPRDSYVLATKLFFPMSPTDQGLSREQVAKQLDASLERLQTDYVDLYQCHRYDPETPLEETMEALTRAVEAGKVRYIGFSEWPPEKIRAAAGIPGVERFVSSQPQYSMLWRQIESEVIPLCESLGISQIVWSPLAQGVLTGKYGTGRVPDDSRAASEAMSGFMDNVLRPEVLSAVQRLEAVAADTGLTMPQLALAWVLRQPNVASAIIGASRPEQVHENAAASGKTLSDATLTAVDEALGGVSLAD